MIRRGWTRPRRRPSTAKNRSRSGAVPTTFRRRRWTSTIRHPCHDRRYATLDRNALPGTESLATTLVRVLPYWHDAIAPQLKAGQTVLVTAHGNSLRALYKYLNDVSNEQILSSISPPAFRCCSSWTTTCRCKASAIWATRKRPSVPPKRWPTRARRSNRRIRRLRCVHGAQRGVGFAARVRTRRAGLTRRRRLFADRTGTA